MDIFSSIAVAYLLSAIIQIRKELTADPITKKPWARHPTFAAILIYGAFWFVLPVVNPLYVAIHLKRSIPKTLAISVLPLLIRMAVLTGMAWCIITLVHRF